MEAEGNGKSEYSRIGYALALIRYIKGYRMKFAASVVVHAIYKALPIVIGFIVSYMIGAAVLGNLTSVRSYLYLVLILVTLDAVFHYLDVMISHDMAYRILKDLRNLAYEKVDELAPTAMEDKQSGDVVSVVMGDIELLEWFYAHTVGELIVAVVVPLIALIVLGRFSWILPAILLPFILLLVIIPTVNREKSDEQGSALRESLGHLNAEIVDGIQGIQDVISFRWQRNYFQRFFNTTKVHNEASLAYASRSANEGRTITLLTGLASLLCDIVIIRLVLQGRVGRLWLLPLFSLTSLVFAPVLATVNMTRNYGMIFAAAKRVFELLQLKPLVNDIGNLRAVDVCPGNMSSQAKVVFRNVQFTYPTRNPEILNMPILEDVSFSFTTGETVALVGASGSGKTTVARLLQRFWDVDGGTIKVNGRDIRELSLRGLRDLVTVVPQDVYLFNLSVEENLRLARKPASSADIRRACQAAQAHDFIMKLPEGYATVVGERGLRLSGGEKQRISIAQAFLKDSPILVLDEASASLDSENERLINEAIGSLKIGRATLVIAHRISTIRNADRIIVIRDGRAFDSGPFQEPERRCGYFCRLTSDAYA